MKNNRKNRKLIALAYKNNTTELKQKINFICKKYPLLFYKGFKLYIKTGDLKIRRIKINYSVYLFKDELHVNHTTIQRKAVNLNQENKIIKYP